MVWARRNTLRASPPAVAATCGTFEGSADDCRFARVLAEIRSGAAPGELVRPDRSLCSASVVTFLPDRPLPQTGPLPESHPPSPCLAGRSSPAAGASGSTASPPPCIEQHIKVNQYDPINPTAPAARSGALPAPRADARGPTSRWQTSHYDLQAIVLPHRLVPLDPDPRAPVGLPKLGRPDEPHRPPARQLVRQGHLAARAGLEVVGHGRVGELRRRLRGRGGEPAELVAQLERADGVCAIARGRTSAWRVR